MRDKRKKADDKREGGVRRGYPRRRAAAAGEAEKLPIRQRYRVDRLPGDVQEAIFQGYLRGDSYNKIRIDVRAMGHRISTAALSRFWRREFRTQADRIRRMRAMKGAIMETLGLKQGDVNAQLVEELIMVALCGKHEELEQEPALVLVRESREERKLRGARGVRGESRGASSTVEQAQEVRRRWRKLYGLDEGDGGEESKPKEE